MQMIYERLRGNEVTLKEFMESSLNSYASVAYQIIVCPGTIRALCALN